MWKCKKCGDKMQGVIDGLIDIDIKGCAIDGTEEELCIIGYCCVSCAPGEIINFGDIKELKRVADWEEEDERD